MISGRRDLQRAYQDDGVAQAYIRNRFESVLGARLHARQVACVLNLIRAQKLREAIEIAPGPARVTVDVAPALERVTLVDASAEMLREARRRLEAAGRARAVRLVRADAFALPIAHACDLVYTFRLIRHFERPDRLKLYRQIAGVLRPGGWFVFDAVNREVSEPLRARTPSGAHQHYDALLDPGAIVSEVREAGFGDPVLHGVQRRYAALEWLQIYVAPRWAKGAEVAMSTVESLGGQPLEWVVVCQRRA